MPSCWPIQKEKGDRRPYFSHSFLKRCPIGGYEGGASEYSDGWSVVVLNEDHRHPRCGPELRTKAHLAEQLMDPNRTNPIALQLWTIRDAIALDADLALGRVKAAGFKTYSEGSSSGPLSAPGNTPQVTWYDASSGHQT